MSAPSASALATLLPDTREAARLGRLVLADRPAAGAAGQALLSRLDAAAHDRTAISDQLDRIVKDQFQTLDTCIVDGWVLARAEAELCAAVALHDKGLT